jgi:hypothetical protein
MGTGIIVIFAVGFVLYWIGAVMEAESHDGLQSAEKIGTRAKTSNRSAHVDGV